MSKPSPSLTDQMVQATELLRTWASLGAEEMIPRPRRVAEWDAAALMIDAVGPKLAAEADQLKVLLTESQRRLAPLDEPFTVDLGLHRWLNGKREETYSDWLEWVVRQAKTPERIYRLFGLGAPPADVLRCETPEIRREFRVPHGHTDKSGRLDLLIRFEDRAIIVVEVKTGDAEDAVTSKQEGYLESLEGNNADKHPLFLAVSAEDEIVDGFSFVSWQAVCLEMRRLALDVANERRWMAGALILAFVAAVEQNLLGFSAQLVQRICDKRAHTFNLQVVDHLERFLTQ